MKNKKGSSMIETLLVVMIIIGINIPMFPIYKKLILMIAEIYG